MSTKDYGCFFCSGKSADYDGICTECHAPINIGEQLCSLTLGEYRATEVLGRGFYGWTLKVEDAFQPFALKILPQFRLRNGGVPEKEARALVACSPHRNIARFVRPLSTAISVLGRNVSVSCMVFEFIPGAVPLSKIVADESLRLAKADVVAILAGVSSGLERMHSNGLWHDDLHDDNVLVREVKSDENLQERFESKLIDFGSAKPLTPGEPESGDRCDYAYLAKHVFNLVLRFEIGSQASLTPADRTFASRLRRLAHRLSDRNVSRRSLEPADVTRELRAALEQCATGHNFPSFAEMKGQSGISFSEPLENTNALNLAPQDISLLFQDALGWQERIVESEPVFVVGPRGCGKTMLLRFLSIASCARPLKMEQSPVEVGSRLAGMKHVGFLVNVGQLRTPFLRSSFKKLEARDQAVAEDFCREFLNCHFAYEVLRSLIWLHEEKMIPLDRDDSALVKATIAGLLPSRSSGDVGTIEALAEALDRRAMELSNLRAPEAYEPTGLCRDDVLDRLAQVLRRTAWGRSKEIWFLLDDYSVTVIPAIAQRAYNPVLFRLSSELRIKASSEGEGPILTDSLGRKYKEGRELSKLNLGEVYFQAKEEDGRRFFEGILEARFRETGKGSLNELLAMLDEHEHESSFGEYISSLSRPGDARFYGFGLLCRLCSGDVSFVIELLDLLTRRRWGQAGLVLTPVEQDAVVKRFAQRQLADLHATAEYGEKLHEFALRMGQLIKNYLLRSKGKEADERLRIEVEDWQQLDPHAQEMHDALLRHSVLITGGSGKSRRGLPTRKFYFRRLFAPCFPFSPTRKGCIPLGFRQYEHWLLNPERIWEEPAEDERPPGDTDPAPSEPELPLA